MPWSSTLRRCDAPSWSSRLEPVIEKYHDILFDFLLMLAFIFDPRAKNEIRDIPLSQQSNASAIAAKNNTNQDDNVTKTLLMPSKTFHKIQTKMKQTMKPKVTRNESTSSSVEGAVVRSAAAPMLPRHHGIDDSHYSPDLISADIDEDMEQFMTLSSSKEDCCSSPSPRNKQTHAIHDIKRQLAWGRLVTDRNDVPDLMSEEVDEEVEIFMILPFDQVEHETCSPSQHYKRSHSSQETGSPSSRRRTEGYCDLQKEVSRWFRAILGPNKKNVDTLFLGEERLLPPRQWTNEHCGQHDMPPPTVLRRHSPSLDREEIHLDRQEVHPKILEREAFLSSPPASAVRQDTHDAAVSQDTFRFDETCGGGGQVEVYPGQQVKIHGKDRAYASLCGGHAAVFQCAGCNERLLANKGTKLLYCQTCGTLTPTDIKGELKDSDLYEEN